MTARAHHSGDGEREALLVAAFCSEIGLPPESVALSTARFDAVAAALQADLLLPLRALQEGA